MHVDPGDMTRLPVVFEWITGAGIRTFNVAGNRESDSPGIGQSFERFLVGLFRQLGLGP
jgi:hypothetical protein